MTHPEALCRPSAGRILSHPFLRHSSPRVSAAACVGGASAAAAAGPSSNRELMRELAAARQRLRELERQLAMQKEENKPSGSTKLLVGRGARRSASGLQLPEHK